MAISINWTITALDTYPTHSDTQDPVNTQNDVIHNAHWSCTASTGSHSNSVYGTTVISTEDLGTFVDFDSLDNDTVVGWVTASMEAMAEGTSTEYETSASASLAEQINPTSVVKYLS